MHCSGEQKERERERQLGKIDTTRDSATARFANPNSLRGQYIPPPLRSPVCTYALYKGTRISYIYLFTLQADAHFPSFVHFSPRLAAQIRAGKKRSDLSRILILLSSPLLLSSRWELEKSITGFLEIFLFIEFHIRSRGKRRGRKRRIGIEAQNL